MALIDIVKPQVGVFYSTPENDAKISQVIDGAISYLNGAGWKVPHRNAPGHTPDAIMAIVIFCKMMLNTDPSAMTNHAVLLSLIAAGRAAPNEI